MSISFFSWLPTSQTVWPEHGQVGDSKHSVCQDLPLCLSHSCWEIWEVAPGWAWSASVPGQEKENATIGSGFIRDCHRHGEEASISKECVCPCTQVGCSRKKWPARSWVLEEFINALGNYLKIHFKPASSTKLVLPLREASGKGLLLTE